MNRVITPVLIALGLLVAVIALAQDAVKVSPAINTVLVENEHVRVVQSTFKPGAVEGTHTHPAGWYIVTKGGTLKITRANGTVEEWKAPTGEQAWQGFEAPHKAQNTGKGTFEYIYVEVKSAAAVGKDKK